MYTFEAPGGIGFEVVGNHRFGSKQTFAWLLPRDARGMAQGQRRGGAAVAGGVPGLSAERGHAAGEHPENAAATAPVPSRSPAKSEPAMATLSQLPNEFRFVSQFFLKGFPFKFKLNQPKKDADSFFSQWKSTGHLSFKRGHVHEGA